MGLSCFDLILNFTKNKGYQDGRLVLEREFSLGLAVFMQVMCL